RDSAAKLSAAKPVAARRRTRTGGPTNASAADLGVAARLATAERSKYLGLSLLLASHYCLWFSPSAFPFTFSVNDSFTFGWLTALGAAAITMFGLTRLLGRGRHLPERPWLAWGAAAALSAAALFLTLRAVPSGQAAPAMASGAVTGSMGAVLWVAWGEGLARQQARFSLAHLAPTYAACVLGGLAVTHLLPGALAPGFVASLPLASAWLLRGQARVLAATDGRAPVLLPRKLAKPGLKSIWTVALICSTAAFTCYYTVAIVPREALWGVCETFTWGVALGAGLLLGMGVGRIRRLGNRSACRALPWLMALTVLACALFLSEAVPGALAFFLALALSSVFEILLTAHMAGLTLRGYVSAAAAFALSGGAIRAGIALGHGTALAYQRLPGWHASLVAPTFLTLIVVLTGMLVILVRQEHTVNELVAEPTRPDDLEAILDEVAAEFKLSEREREVAALIGRGYTAAAAAETLVISHYTVNSHIGHIYAKMGIHKRAELIRYLHRRP
ncbi:MAG: helix-turn-helix transcriptional regulator, partial [Bifidobacteriaceae bacterium]|nr:helix-turn-helix transcriptional regulator [Bifidobacteriaceae bacterium]